MSARRPDPTEYDEFYADYVERLADGPILPRLAEQVRELGELLDRLTPDGAGYRYAPEKWSVRQILGHLADSERIFGMRATCIARGETADLPGFEQDDYVAEGGFDERTLESLRREFEALRSANLEMFRALPENHWNRIGRASDTPVSVRALAWILVGHLDRHLASLRERYADAFLPAS